MKTELLAGIAGLLADTEGTDEHDLPGWDRYRRDVGNDDASRKLFAEMLKANDLRVQFRKTAHAGYEKPPRGVWGYF